MWRCSGACRTSGWQCHQGRWVHRSGTEEQKARPWGCIRLALQDLRKTVGVLMRPRQRREQVETLSRALSAEKAFEDASVVGGRLKHGRQVHKTGGKVKAKTL